MREIGSRSMSGSGSGSEKENERIEACKLSRTLGGSAVMRSEMETLLQAMPAEWAWACS